MEYNIQTGFPSEFEPPKVKEGKDWLVKYARAAWGNYSLLPLGAIGMKSRDRYELIKAYSRGEQPTDKYKNILLPTEDMSNIGLVVDWSVIPITKRMRQSALGLLSKQMYDIVINPIDPAARNDIQQSILEMRGKILARMVAAQNQNPQIANSPALIPEPEEPEDLDGVEVVSTSLRHRTAMEAEEVWELVAAQNNWQMVRELALESLMDYGVAIVQDETDGDFVKLHNVDLRRWVQNFCTYPDFSDLMYGGEIKMIPVSKLQVASQGQLSDEDLDKIYSCCVSNNWTVSGFNMSSFTGGYSDWYNRGKVAVLELKILSTDEIIREERINRAGNLVYAPSRDVNNPQKSTIHKNKVESVYRISWIVGTEYAYNYGREFDIKRNPKNLSQAKLPYHIVTCSGFHDMKVKSRMDDLIPIADNIQMAYYKMQDALNRATPKGFSLDLDALEDVALTVGQKELKGSSLAALYKQTGTILYRSKGLDGKGGGKPFEQLDNGINDAIQQFRDAVLHYIEIGNSILGLNDITDGSTPNAKTLNGVAQMAAQGTNNALSDIYSADERMSKSVAESVIIRAQDIIKAGNGQSFLNALGTGTLTILKDTPNIDAYTYGIEIEAKPTQDELAKLDGQIQIALTTGQITIDDVVFLDAFKNVKQKAMFLAYKVRKNREKAQQEKIQADQMNSKGQAQAAQVAEQSKQQTLQMEYELNIRLMVAEKAEERKNIQIKGAYDLERERIAGTGRVEASYVQAKERQDSNIRTNTTDLIKNDKGEETHKIDIKADLESAIEPVTTQQQPNLNIPDEDVGTPSVLGGQETPQQEQAEPIQEPAQQEMAEGQSSQEEINEPTQESPQGGGEVMVV